jgi:hypothetical protein
MNRRASTFRSACFKSKGFTSNDLTQTRYRGSKYVHMRELRCQHEGRPYRVLYAFDPRRTAILLIGGEKTGNLNWYKEFIPKADRIYAQHLKAIDA